MPTDKELKLMLVNASITIAQQCMSGAATFIRAAADTIDGFAKSMASTAGMMMQLQIEQLRQEHIKDVAANPPKV